MAKHVTFGGSTIARTIACPSWVEQAKKSPTKESSSAALEGTLLHNAMESFGADYSFEMSQAEKLRDFTSPETKDRKVTHDLFDNKLYPAMCGIVDTITLFDLTQISVEPYVSIAEDVGGSIDFIGLSRDRKTLVVCDYKFGFSPVDVVENKQLMFYALCALLDEKDIFDGVLLDDVEHIHLTVIQPTNMPITAHYTLTKEAILNGFADEVGHAIGLAREGGDGELNTGEHCYYCPAFTTCKQSLERAEAAKYMTPVQLDTLAQNLGSIEYLEKWIKAVKATAEEQLSLGAEVEGYKLVRKRAYPKWGDAEGLRNKVKRSKKLTLGEVVEKNLISPAKFRKLCEKKGLEYSDFSEYTVTESSGFTVVPESDARKKVRAIETQKS